jgi:fatty acid synthase
VEELVARLRSKGALAKEIDSCGMAFHSPLLSGAGRVFAGSLQEVLGEPRARSARWLSTSVPPGSEDAGLEADVDYFVNNLLEPVYFEHAIQRVPSGSCVIEVGPHALLESILKGSIDDIRYVSFLNKNSSQDRKEHQRREDPVGGSILEGIGRCYLSGCTPRWHSLDAHLAAPPFRLNHLVSWNHEEEWPLPEPTLGSTRQAPGFVKRFTIDIDKPENAYIKHHVVEGRVIIPGVTYLHLVWQTMAASRGTTIEGLALEVDEIQFHRATVFLSSSSVTLTVSYDQVSSSFSIYEQDQLVCSGKVSRVGQAEIQEDDWSNGWDFAVAADGSNESLAIRPESGMDRETLYRHFSVLGFEYGKLFMGIQSVSPDLQRATIEWDGNWVTFIDALVQLIVLTRDEKQLGVPVKISSFKVAPQLMAEALEGDDGESSAQKPWVKALINKSTGVIKTPFVQVEGVETNILRSTPQRETEHLEMRFVANFETSQLADEVAEYIEVCRRYVRHSVNQLIAREAAAGRRPAPHVVRLYEIINSCPQEPEVFDEERAAAFCDHPNGIGMRLVRHVFEHPDQLLSDPMPLIVSFHEHNAFYRADLSYQERDRYLKNLLDMVVENCERNDIEVCEIGAGTGSVTSVAVPYLSRFRVRYTVTDISAGFLPDLKNELKEYQPTTSYAAWDVTVPPVESEAGRYHLMIASNALHASCNLRRSLRNIALGLRDGGFLLLEELTEAYPIFLGVWGFIADTWRVEDPQDRTHGMLLSADSWVQLLAEEGFTLVAAKHTPGSSAIMLLRKEHANHGPVIEIEYDAAAGNHLQEIQNQIRMAAEDGDARLWIHGSYSSAPGLPGMMHCLRKEYPGLVRSLYYADESRPDEAAKAAALRADQVINVWKNNQWGSYRPLPYPEARGRQVSTGSSGLKLDIQHPGDLSSLRWISAPPISKGQRRCTVKAFALNYKDALMATSQLPLQFAGPQGLALGIDYAGAAEDGQRVCGIAKTGIATQVVLDNPLLYWEIPEQWSYEEAATVPLVYATAYAAIVLCAQARSGQSILIHSGAGGFGQAALRVALDLGLEVFTTIGRDEKRAFLLQQYPQLEESRIGPSRSTDFKYMIREQTHGRGVDIVLNTLVQEKLMAGLEVLAEHGSFIEIGRYDISQNTPLPMAVFMKGISFHCLMLDLIIANNPEKMRAVHRLVADGIKNGTVAPINATIYSPDDISRAMKTLYQGHHKGKLVVQMGREAETLMSSSQPKLWCSPDKCYLVTGGMGGIGLELTRWLIDRGARHVVLTSRSRQRSPYQDFRLRRWSDQGLDIRVSTCDVRSAEETEQLLLEIEAARPLGGLFHLAMVLEDRRFLDLDDDSFAAASDIKLRGAQNLDDYTRRLCQELDHFVAFSSIVSYVGNEGQANYAYGNFAMEQVCERRRLDGLPATAIQWGPIGDVGFVARHREYVDLNQLPAELQSLPSLLDSLETFILGEVPIVASWGSPQRKQDKAELAAARGDLVSSVLEILGYTLSPENLDEETLLADLGMDSLMAVEIRQLLNRHHSIDVSLAEVRNLDLRALRSFSQPPGENERDQAQSLPEQQQQRHLLVLGNEAEHGMTPVKPRVCYFFHGICIDPERSLQSLALPEDTTFVLAPYPPESGRLQTLAEQLLHHLDQLPDGVEEVHLMSFSFGSSVLANLLMLAPELPRKIDFITGIAPASAEILTLLDADRIRRHMQKELSEQSADSSFDIFQLLLDPQHHARFSDAMYSYLRGLYPDLKREDLLGYEALIRQIKFSLEQIEPELQLEADRIVLFSDDPLGIEPVVAERQGQEVIVLEGTHNITHVGISSLLRRS